MKKQPPEECPPAAGIFTRFEGFGASSSEAGTGSREENAKTRIKSPALT
jgi:hypothetical protein